MLKPRVSMNGVLLPYEQATIHIASGAMKYGASVFEGIRGYWQGDRSCLRLLELDRHLKRLIESMRLMRMDTAYSVSQLKGMVEELVVGNQMTQDCYIRVAASIAGEGGIDQTGPVVLSITQSPKGRHSKYRSGVHVSISGWTRITDAMMPPRLKCVANYQNGRLAKLQAKLDGYDDTLLLNHLGYIAEAPTASFFMVRGGELITPPVSADILASITRALLLRIAPIIGIRAKEEQITRTDSYLADEAFLCGTGAEIVPVISIDRHALCTTAAGQVTSQLRAAFESVAYGHTVSDPDPAVTIELENYVSSISNPAV